MRPEYILPFHSAVLSIAMTVHPQILSSHARKDGFQQSLQHADRAHRKPLCIKMRRVISALMMKDLACARLESEGPF